MTAPEKRYDGKVVWITGGANGFGAAAARRLAGLGASVVVTDVETEAGEALAGEIGGSFRRCDVSSYDDVRATVDAIIADAGRIDIAFLNAGVATGMGLGADFDPAAYRRVMGINLDGVVYGMSAALAVMSERGSGDIVATASLAGLTAVPFDPIYAANKHGVVGLVRSVGQASTAQGVRVNGLCPGFADTRIVDPIRDLLSGQGLGLIPVDQVIDTLLAILASEESGQCWFVQVGRESQPFAFRGVPGPR